MSAIASEPNVQIAAARRTVPAQSFSLREVNMTEISFAGVSDWRRSVLQDSYSTFQHPARA
jgi:hypothetical protein